MQLRTDNIITYELGGLAALLNKTAKLKTKTKIKTEKFGLMTKTKTKTNTKTEKFGLKTKTKTKT